MTPEKISVLIVDDQPEIRMLVRSTLTFAGGFEILAEATNGAEAVTMAADHSPDIVVLDVAMPVMSGLDALPKIIRMSPASKVVIFSAHDDPRLAEVARDRGAHEYLSKVASCDLPHKLRSVWNPAR